MRNIRVVAVCIVWSFAASAAGYCLGSLQKVTGAMDRVAAGLRLDAVPQASLVYDRNGVLVFSFAAEDRTAVPLGHMSPHLIDAVLHAEDRNFFRHRGVDIAAVLRAAWVDLRAWDIRQGGSTITQQLVRSLALGADRSLTRKVREALLAFRAERRFSKTHILEAYLNRVYFGSGHYGVEAAARGYFGKPARELDLSESALLAAIIPCPSACSPRIDLRAAAERRAGVLTALHDRGVITEEQRRSAAHAAIALVPEGQHLSAAGAGGHFFEVVRRDALERFGVEAVMEGGLRIHTTIDMTLQREAERVVRDRLDEIDRTGTLEGALVALDPQTGDVLAMVGGRDFGKSPFNRATQAWRQPGSAFKPLLFAAALEQGFAPATPLEPMDEPIGDVGGPWLPAEHGTATTYTMRQALTVSSNRAAVRVLQLVGMSTARTYASRLGIRSSLPLVPSLALGTGEVTLLDLTSAYGVFANGGVRVVPTLITRVEDDGGDVVWQRGFDQTAYRALRPGTAYLMSSMMADVVTRGTGARARAEGFTLPAAGKTGTTDDYADAWFIGYTPHLVAGVWFGFDERKPIARRGYAASVAVPAWARFMKAATAGEKAGWLKMPGDVERVAVCRRSGLRAAPACAHAWTDDAKPNVFSDLYLLGTGPYETCSGVHEGEEPADGLPPAPSPAL